MSVNQKMFTTLCYLEAHHTIYNPSAKAIKMKWSKKDESQYFFRNDVKNDQKISEKPMKKCTGITYQRAKLFNTLPSGVKKTQNKDTFNCLIKTWIWKHIPQH